MAIATYYLTDKVKLIVERGQDGYLATLTDHDRLEEFGPYPTMAETFTEINKRFGLLILAKVFEERNK